MVCPCLICIVTPFSTSFPFVPCLHIQPQGSRTSRWKDVTMEDQLWLKKNFDNYKALQRSSFGLDSDEKTFPTYMGKRYALNVPPSSLLCDGLSMCRVCLMSLAHM